jgi:putative MATE family efflux protein
MRKVSREEILTGNPTKIMFMLGLPVMLSQFLFTLYNLADTFWLGHLPTSESASAVAGMQVAWPIIWFLMAFSFGFGIAGVALVSQYTGAGDHEKAEFSASQVMSVSLLFGVFVGILGFFLMPFIASLVTHVKDVSNIAVLYMKIFFIGVPFTFISFAFQQILSAKGDNVTPMQISLITVSLNVILDPFLIFGWWIFPKMGVQGAALATIISEGIAAIIGLYMLFKGFKGIKITLKNMTPDFTWFKRIFKIGLPAAIGSSTTAFGFLVLVGIIGRTVNAEVALSAYGIGDRLVNVIFIVVEGVGASIVTMVGQNLGANLIDRVEKIARTGIKVEFLITIVECVIIFLLRSVIFKVFIPGRLDVVKEGVLFLSIFSFGLPFFGLFSAVAGVFRGSGHNTPPMIADIIRLWVVRVPFAYLFSLRWGTAGIWWAMTLSNVIASSAAYFIYLKGNWKKAIIHEEAKPEVLPVIPEE